MLFLFPPSKQEKYQTVCVWRGGGSDWVDSGLEEIPAIHHFPQPAAQSSYFTWPFGRAIPVRKGSQESKQHGWELANLSYKVTMVGRLMPRTSPGPPSGRGSVPSAAPDCLIMRQAQRLPTPSLGKKKMEMELLSFF